MAGGAAGAAVAAPAAIPVAVTPSAAVMTAPATSFFTFTFICNTCLVAIAVDLPIHPKLASGPMIALSSS